MMVLFEVFLTPGSDGSRLLTAEVLAQTQAQVMTLADARKVGFGGMPDPPAGKEVRLIAVAKRDEAWVLRELEGSGQVSSFRVHEVG